MNKKILFSKEKNKYYSYHDIYTYRNKGILGSLNKNMEKGENNIHCKCKGLSKEGIKMHTRKISGGYYTLVDSANSNHDLDCPKLQESFIKNMICSKMRDKFLKDIDINVLSGDGGVIYSADLYFLGEAILSEANNMYIDRYNKTGTQNQVMSYLYGYYDNNIKRGIKSPYNSFRFSDNLLVENKISNTLTVGDIMFNPKWIKCDDIEDKTSSVIKNSREINKRYSEEYGNIDQYILAKYMSYSNSEGNLVKIKLYIRGKRKDVNNEKSIYLYMDKFKFFDILNKSKPYNSIDLYVSALIYEDKGRLMVDKMAFIPVYPKYCISIDSTDQFNTVKDLLKIRDRIAIKRIGKIDKSYDKEFNGAIPDFVVNIIGTSRTVLIESFDYIFQEYYEEMNNKIGKYTQLIENNKDYEFLAICNNLGWSSPPLSIILNNEFKTMINIDKRVETSIQKLLYKNVEHY